MGPKAAAATAAATAAAALALTVFPGGAAGTTTEPNGDAPIEPSPELLTTRPCGDIDEDDGVVRPSPLLLAYSGAPRLVWREPRSCRLVSMIVFWSSFTQLTWPLLSVAMLCPPLSPSMEPVNGSQLEPAANCAYKFCGITIC